MTVRRERDEVISQRAGRKESLDIIPVVQFKNGEATPSVINTTRAKCGSTVVTITNFKLGSDNQELKILGNDNTTIKNNANIQTNTGADKVLVTGIVYTFTRFSGKWYENE